MKNELQLQLQAYLDGELSGAEVRAVETRLQEDAAACGLLAELRQTRSALSGQELLRPVPESREFYWSKIARQIGSETPHRAAESSARPAWWSWLRPVFSPTGSVAASLVLLAVGTFWLAGRGQVPTQHETELTEPKTHMLSYRDQQDGVTVVWLSYNE